MAKFYVLKKLSLQVGPQIGFVVSAEDELVSNVPSLQSSTRDVTTDYKTIDYGLNFGIGLNLTKKLFADVRYSIGLDQIVKELPALSDGGKNRVFSLNLGYAF